MMRPVKKLISGLMALVMVMTMLPMNVFADPNQFNSGSTTFGQVSGYAAETATVAVDGEIEIQKPNTNASWTITAGENCVDVEERNGKLYVEGEEPGTATIVFSWKNGWRTYTQTYNITVTPKAEEVLGTHKLYFYGLIPGKTADTGNADANWFGLGVGTISNVPDPATLNHGDAPVGGAVSAPGGYPDLEMNGVWYKYGEGYTLTPMRIRVAPGANAGNNKYNETAPYAENTYHYDHYVVLNEAKVYTVQFLVQDPGFDDFAAVDGYRVDEGTSESSLTKPSTADVEYNGFTYKFDGWYLDEACTQKANFDGEINANTKYYGKYVVAEAALTYDPGDGDGTPVTEKHAVDKQTNKGKSNAKNAKELKFSKTKDGQTYALTGWQDQNGNTYAVGAEVELPAGQNTVLTAQWSTQVTLTYYDAKGKVIETEPYTIGDTVTVESKGLTQNDNSGKHWLVGWTSSQSASGLTGQGNYVVNGKDALELFKNSGCYYPVGKQFEIQTNMELWPVWSGDSSKLTYTLTINYVYEDGSSTGLPSYSGTYAFMTEYSVQSPSLEGYSPDKLVVSGTMGTENRTIDVIYRPNQYSVTYQFTGAVPAGVTPPSTKNYPYSSTVTVENTPAEVPGYTFDGWTTQDVAVTDGEFTMPNKAVVFTGVWSQDKYTVIYQPGTQGTFNESTNNNLVYGADMPDAPDAANEHNPGYTFTGWSDGTNTYTTLPTTVTGSVTYVAQWTVRDDLSYTVNYLEQDNTPDDDSDNKVLHDPKTMNDQTFDAEVTEEAIDIDGYNKVAPTSQKITIAVEDNVINFYYIKQVAGLSVVKTSDTAEATVCTVGDEIGYTITVQNTGNVELKNILVTDPMTKGSWTIDELEAGESSDPIETAYKVTLADVLKATKDNHLLVNTAYAEAPNPLYVPPVAALAEDVATATTTQPEKLTASYSVQNTLAYRDLQIVKTVVNPKDVYDFGEVIQYRITVKNNGTYAEPAGLTIVDHMNNATGNVTYIGDGWTNGVYTLGALAANGGTEVAYCSYTVPEADAGRVIFNTAAVRSGTAIQDTANTPGEQIMPLYTLTILYLDADTGLPLAANYVTRMRAGTPFYVVSPVIAGYTTKVEAVQSGVNGMPAQDLAIPVLYTAIAPEEEPEEEPEINVVTPTDDGGYDLTPISELDTPLANMDLGDHTCCIMHFLLMLASLITLAFYTDSRKKHQARIHQLKESLKAEGKNDPSEKM